MKVQQIPVPLLQRMRFEVPDLKFLRMYFEGVPAENEAYIRKVTLPPVTAVRGMKDTNPGVLVYLSAKAGKKKASEFFGVSESFFSGIIDSLLVGPVAVSQEDIDWVHKASNLFHDWSPEALYELVPFSRFIRHFMYLSAKEAKQRFPNESMGNHSSARGLKGEDLYEVLRKDQILKNMNKEENPQFEYDFEDKEYGKVNVKSSKSFERKGGDRYWKFSTKGNQEFFACIGFDALFERPLFMIMLQAPPLMDKGSFVIEESQIEIGTHTPVWLAGDSGTDVE